MSFGKLPILLLVSAVILSGCIGQPQPTTEQPVPAPVTAQASLTVSSQSLVGDEIVVDNLYLDKPGYLVIHKDADGKPGPVIGHSDLLSGEKNNSKVSIDASQAGTKVFAMLHYDDDNDGVYGFPDEDKPVTLEGNAIVKSIALTQQAPTPSPPSSGETKEFKITIEHSGGYSPNKISVSKGDTVKILAISNQPSHEHGITIDAYNINKAVLKSSFADSDIIEFTADKSGAFEMYCKTCETGPLLAHPWMKGTLEVK